MELDSLKYVWKKVSETEMPVRDEDYFARLISQKFLDPISKMRKNLLTELVLAIIFYIPVIAWYFLGFNGKLPEPALFLTVMAAMFVIYYFRKNKLLNRLEVSDCKIKQSLEQQLLELENYTRFYFYNAVLAVPFFLCLFLFLLYGKLPHSGSFFYRTAGNSIWPVVLLWVIIFSFCTGIAFYANRWYIKKVYGQHIQKLKDILNEMDYA